MMRLFLSLLLIASVAGCETTENRQENLAEDQRIRAIMALPICQAVARTQSDHRWPVRRCDLQDATCFLYDEGISCVSR